MTTKDEVRSTVEALKMALDALEETRNALAWFYDSYPEDVTPKGNELLPHVEVVLAALRRALEQVEQPAYQYLLEQNRQLTAELAKFRAVSAQALEFVEFCWRDVDMSEYAMEKREETEIALRRALEQPAPVPEAHEQEPVAWVNANSLQGLTLGHYAYAEIYTDESAGRIPLYTCPAERKLEDKPLAQAPATPLHGEPLTDEQISDLWDGHAVPVFGKTGINPIVFARAIEAAHGITSGEATLGEKK